MLSTGPQCSGCTSKVSWENSKLDAMRTQKAIQVLASSISTSWIYQGLGVVGSKARIFSQLSHLQVAPLLYKRPQSSQTSPHL